VGGGGGGGGGGEGGGGGGRGYRVRRANVRDGCRDVQREEASVKETLGASLALS